MIFGGGKTDLGGSLNTAFHMWFEIGYGTDLKYDFILNRNVTHISFQLYLVVSHGQHSSLLSTGGDTLQ